MLTPEELAIIQAEANETIQLIAQKQAEIQKLTKDVGFWRDAANAAAKGGADVRGTCTRIYNGLRADFANANAELRQLQDQLQRLRSLLAGAGGAAAAAAGGLYATATGVFTAPTVGASFTGFGITGGAIAGSAAVGAAAVGAGIGYWASQLSVMGGGTVADFWGDLFCSACPSCFR